MVSAKIIKRSVASSSLYYLQVECVAAECGMKLYKTSVKEDLNVDLVFQHLAENYVKKVTWLTIIQTCT